MKLRDFRPVLLTLFLCVALMFSIFPAAHTSAQVAPLEPNLTRLSPLTTPAATLEAVVPSTNATNAPDLPAFALELAKQALALAIQWGLPVIILTIILDGAARIFPPLTPFRSAILAWIQQKLDEWAHDQAKRAVLASGQLYRVKLEALTRDRIMVPEDTITTLKDARFNNVVNELVGRRVAPNENAARLIEGAVGELKSAGVNP
jgi:hypothetical protein